VQADPDRWRTGLSVEIRIEYTSHEFVRMYRRNLLHNPSIWFVFALGAFLAILGAIILSGALGGQNSTIELFGSCFVVVRIILIAVFNFTLYMAPRRLWRRVGARIEDR
jgi:hypothetical protein